MPSFTHRLAASACVVLALAGCATAPGTPDGPPTALQLPIQTAW